VTEPQTTEELVYTTDTGATFSPCKRYRYALWRMWDASLPTVVFCGLNPSTADEKKNDPTVTRELGYARAWGFGRYVKVNAYGLRSTDPKQLWKTADPRGLDNFLAIKIHCFEAMTKRQGGLFVAAWGNNILAPDERELRQMLRLEGVKVHAIGITKGGHPVHPLYQLKTAKPFEWMAA
jgi:hypothetical protein